MVYNHHRIFRAAIHDFTLSSGYLPEEGSHHVCIGADKFSLGGKMLHINLRYSTKKEKIWGDKMKFLYSSTSVGWDRLMRKASLVQIFQLKQGKKNKDQMNMERWKQWYQMELFTIVHQWNRNLIEYFTNSTKIFVWFPHIFCFV